MNGYVRNTGYRCLFKFYTINAGFTAITLSGKETCTGKYPNDIPRMYWGYNT